MHFEIRSVNPTIAADWLAKPWVRQRTLSPATVRKYARAMQEGRWEEPSLDPIGFTPEGELGNGQHRLNAVIAADWSGDMLIAVDVPDENFLVHDTGRHRLAAQFVRLPRAKDVAAITRLVLWYDNRHPERPNGAAAQFDNDEVLEFIDANADLLEAVVRRAWSAQTAMGMPCSVHGAVMFIALRGGIPEETVDDWLDGLITGAQLAANDPRLSLRNRLVKTPSIKRDRVAMWYLVVRAWNAFYEGRPLTSLQADTTDPVPVVRFTRHQKTAQRSIAAIASRSAAAKATRAKYGVDALNQARSRRGTYVAASAAEGH